MGQNQIRHESYPSPLDAFEQHVSAATAWAVWGQHSQLLNVRLCSGQACRPAPELHGFLQRCTFALDSDEAQAAPHARMRFASAMSTLFMAALHLKTVPAAMLFHEELLIGDGAMGIFL